MSDATQFRVETKSNLLPRFTELIERIADSAVTESEDATFLQFAHVLIKEALGKGASDIHIDPYREAFLVRIRVDGQIHNVTELGLDLGQRLGGRLKTMAGIDPVPVKDPVDGSVPYQLEEVCLTLRVACVPAVGGEKLTVRILVPERDYIELEHLGMLPSQSRLLLEWLDTLEGMLLVGGSTGSGKTTTLYSILHHMRQHYGTGITIEDPVEYKIEGVTQLEILPERDLDFERYLRSALRHDPDYILVGEIRGYDSANSAVDAAAIGHCLFSTLHSRKLAGLITSLRNYDVQDHEIAASMEVGLSQRLLRKLCPMCRTKKALKKKEFTDLETMQVTGIEAVYEAEGCEHCLGTGYYGRSGLFDLWRLNDEDKSLIAEGATENEIHARLAPTIQEQRAERLSELLKNGEVGIQHARFLLSQ